MSHHASPRMGLKLDERGAHKIAGAQLSSPVNLQPGNSDKLVEPLNIFVKFGYKYGINSQQQQMQFL